MQQFTVLQGGEVSGGAGCSKADITEIVQAVEKLFDGCDGAGRVPGVRIMWRKLVGTLFAILGLMLWADVAPAATLVGTVFAVSGSCTARGRALKPGDAVQVSDTVDVPTGSKLKLRMIDESMISVAPESSVTVASYSLDGAGRHANLLLTQGLLRIVVAPLGGPSIFEVSTAVGTASVRSGSADWFFDAQARSAQVGVLVGDVDLTSAATRRSVSIPGHWGARLEAGRDPVPPRNWTVAEFDAVTHSTE
jgi:hypothetical protein